MCLWWGWYLKRLFSLSGHWHFRCLFMFLVNSLRLQIWLFFIHHRVSHCCYLLLLLLMMMTCSSVSCSSSFWHSLSLRVQVFDTFYPLKTVYLLFLIKAEIYFRLIESFILKSSKLITKYSPSIHVEIKSLICILHNKHFSSSSLDQQKKKKKPKKPPNVSLFFVHQINCPIQTNW